VSPGGADAGDLADKLRRALQSAERSDAGADRPLELGRVAARVIALYETVLARGSGAPKRA